VRWPSADSGQLGDAWAAFLTPARAAYWPFIGHAIAKPRKRQGFALGFRLAMANIHRRARRATAVSKDGYAAGDVAGVAIVARLAPDATPAPRRALLSHMWRG